MKLYLFHYKSFKQEKEAGTNFVLLRQLRNIVGQFKRFYLDRPIKALHLLTPARNQKCLT